MKHHYSAIDLNDSGVCSLLHHKYEEATGFFRSALSLMREATIRERQQQQQQQHHQQHISKLSSSVTVAQEDWLYESVDIEFYEPSRTNKKFLCKSGFQDPIICKMAITISGAAATRRRGSTTKSLTSAVIYNLAITTHLWGLQSGSSAHLQKALRLYEILYKTHQGDDITGPSTFLAVATALNNVASIHVVLGNHELATQCLQELLAVMSYCCTPPAGSPTAKYGSSWNICWVNILTLLLGPPSTAGAA